MRSRRRIVFAAAISLAGLTSCSEPSEAPRVELPVVVDAAGITVVTSDLGYEVEVSSARIVIEGVVFTVAGEVHASSLLRTLSDALVPTAHAHPGHYQGGEVTGELPGEFVIDWPTDDGRELGAATLITATYSASNFTFGRGSEAVLGADDPLVGHTAIISGEATKGGATIAFTITVDSPEERELVGAPFEADIREDSAGTLNLRFNTLDSLEMDTLFDGVDFAALDADGDGVVLLGPIEDDTYNTFRRGFQTHDHYNIQYRE